MNVGTQTGGRKSGVEKWRSGHPERNGSAHSDVLADSVDGVGCEFPNGAHCTLAGCDGRGRNGRPVFLGGTLKPLTRLVNTDVCSSSIPLACPHAAYTYL